MDKLMPGFDTEIARTAQRLLIQGRPIDYHLGVIATKVTPGVPGVKPVTIELTDFKTKKVVDTLEVDACMVATGRAPYTNGARHVWRLGDPDRLQACCLFPHMQCNSTAHQALQGARVCFLAACTALIQRACNNQGQSLLHTRGLGSTKSVTRRLSHVLHARYCICISEYKQATLVSDLNTVCAGLLVDCFSFAARA